MSILDFIRFCYGKSNLDVMSGTCQRPLNILRAWVGLFSVDIIRFEFHIHMTMITMTMTMTMTKILTMTTMMTKISKIGKMPRVCAFSSICPTGGAQLVSKYNGLPCRRAGCLASRRRMQARGGFCQTHLSISQIWSYSSSNHTRPCLKLSFGNRRSVLTITFTLMKGDSCGR